MDKEDKFWLSLWAIIIVGVMFVAGCLTTYNIYATKLYIENNYEQVMLVGNNQSQWQKVK